MKRRRAANRAPFVVTLVSLVALPACGGKTDSDAGGAGAGAGGKTTNPPPPELVCPTNLPEIGTACAVSGPCSYDLCGQQGINKIVACEGGHWKTVGAGSCNPPPPEGTCPMSLPATGATCTLTSGTSCEYPGVCCPLETATCQGGVWQVVSIDCNPPPPLPCPASLPEAGSSCQTEPCSTQTSTCSYDLCGDPSPDAQAFCDGFTWTVTMDDLCGPLPACEKLGACECFDRPDCKALSDSCICPCDYNCQGDPPCVCACGGGQFLGCAPA